MPNHARKLNAESSPGHNQKQNPSKAAPRAVFRFLENYGATNGDTVKYNYKEPKLVKTKSKWYIEYTYRVPPIFREKLPHKYTRNWHRFKVYEDINTFRTEEYAALLLGAIKKGLEEGYNPFDKLKDELNAPVKTADWSLNYGLEQFMAYCTAKGLRRKTLQTYDIMCNFLRDYFLKDNKIYQPIPFFTREVVSRLMLDLKTGKGWNNNTYNNYLSLLSTIFNWFVREGRLDKSPIMGLEQKKSTITVHKYYNDEQAKQLKDRLRIANPHLYNFCQFIYYTGTRPKSEARLLQVKHLLFDRRMIFIPGHISKNKKDDYIPMAPELYDMLLPLKDQNPELYLWGTKGVSTKPASQNHFAALYKPFKDALGLDENYTIYAWKHSRAIHLANAGVDPYAIMKLFRHSGLDVTMRYLRDLGCEVDWNKYNIDKKF